jgi:hypothetical protein
MTDPEKLIELAEAKGNSAHQDEPGRKNHYQIVRCAGRTTPDPTNLHNGLSG